MAENIDPTKASPLARKIMSGVAYVCNGNGITKKDIEFCREETGKFKLESLLELNFTVDLDNKPKKSKDHQTHIYASRAEMDEEIERATNELMLGPEAMAVVEDDILSRPAMGLESDNPVYPIKGLHYNFGFKEPCRTCQGKGNGGCPVCHGKGQSVCPQCRGERTEWCGQCKGTGHQGTGQLNEPLCTWCGGDGRTRCLRCDGHGVTKCQPCNGTGHSHCRDCGGSGETEHVMGLSFAWRVQAHRLSLEPPRAVSHLLGKAPMGALASKGHLPMAIAGKPMTSPPDTTDDDTRRSIKAQPHSLYYRIESAVPWCETIVKVKDSAALDITAAGRKGRINHCPYFLDKHSDKAKRLYNEALKNILHLGIKKADIVVAKKYPIGLSARARRDVLIKARSKIIAQTKKERILAWLLSIAVTIGPSWFVGDWMGALLGAIMGIIVFHGLILFGKIQFASAHKFKYTPRPRLGWEVLVMIVLAFAIYGYGLFF